MRRWQIRQDGERWSVLDPEGNEVRGARRLPTYQAALGHLAMLAQADMAAFAEEESDDRVRWEGELAFEGDDRGRTSDDRILEEGSLSWRSVPLPLMLQTETDWGHFGAVLAGSIETVELRDSVLYGTGTVDRSEDGQRLQQVLEDHERYGVSIDVGEMDADFECTETEVDPIWGEYCVEGELRVHAAEVMGATATPFPAFADAFIGLASDASEGSGEAEAVAAAAEDGEATTEAPGASQGVEVPQTGVGLMAAGVAIPMAPPSQWFDDPALEALTPLTVTEDGRVFGHLAPWGECHIGVEGACVTAPRSASGYSYFTTGSVEPEDCETCGALATGVITMGTGHAPIQATGRAAVEHYDNTGTGVADVAAGEDEYGIWIAGALRPGVTDEQVRALRGSSLSGDWRRIGGSLELVGALAVNVPGFPIPRAQTRLASGVPEALVAAGVARPRDPRDQKIADLEATVKRMEPIVAALEHDAADRILARIESE